MNDKIKNLNFTYLFILATVSFLWFLFKDHTAYQWPAIDMMPFFERYYDNSFLINDFFTNAISNEPNPRWAFGYFIIGIAKLFNTDWYTVSYSLKVILVIFTPILYYLVLYFTVSKFIDKDKLKSIQIILLLAILIVIYPRFSGMFSIAWWKPYFIQSAPQNISLFFGLLAIVVKEMSYEKRINNYYSFLLFAIATFIHPAMGLFVIAFYILANFNAYKQEYMYYINIFIFGFLVPILFIELFFSPESSLDTIDFVNIYTIENHSSHYHLNNFGTHTPFSWVYSFILMSILLIIPIVYAYFKNIKKLLVVSSLFLSSFILAVAFQYIFIDIFPSKIIASIGPVRFTQFTYWMIAVSWSVMLSNLWFLNKLNFNFNFKKIYILILGGYLLLGITLIDNPKEDIYGKDKDIYEFVNTTDKNSVFAVYFGNFKLDIPNIGKRAVFSGNGFPFNEGYFKEYQKRKSLLYGDREQIDKIKGKWIGEKIAQYFRQKLPTYFVNISNNYKLDYVVVEKNFSSNFKSFTPRFENNKLKIYKISDFKENK